MQSLLCLKQASVEAWFDSRPTRFPASVSGVVSRKHANPVFIIATFLSAARTAGRIQSSHKLLAREATFNDHFNKVTAAKEAFSKAL